MRIEEQKAVGVAARRLLEFAWTRERWNRYLVAQAIRCVMRSFESDPEAAGRLLRTALATSHLNAHGHDEGFMLTSELKRLHSVDPVFVRDVYSSLFGFAETSEEETALGDSGILPLRSTKRQDYEGALYMLAHRFPDFLKKAPLQATEALVAAVRSYVSQRHARQFEKYLGGPFTIMGRDALLEPDGSCMWDESAVYKKDHAVEMLDTFEAFLLAEGVADQSLCDAIIAILAEQNRSAVVWRRVIAAATKAPNTLGVRVSDLLSATPVLRALDTSSLAGGYIEAVSPYLSVDERAGIERAILLLSDEVEGDERKWSDEVRDRLLGCIPDALVTTPEAQERVRELRSAGGAPANEPPFRMSVGSWGDEALIANRLLRSRKGGDPEIQRICDRLTTMQSTQQSDENMTEVTDELVVLHKALSGRDNDADPLLEDAWGTLAEAAARLAGHAKVDEHSAVPALSQILFDAAPIGAEDVEPLTNPGFDDFPSWSSPDRRVAAAQGLVGLGRFAPGATPTHLDRIDRLSRDPSPAVRLQIANGLWVFHKTAAEWMWRVVERMAREDPSPGVLHWLVSGSLERLATIDADRALALGVVIYRRFDSGPGVDELHKACLVDLAGWYAWRNNHVAKDALAELKAQRPISTKAATHVCSDLRKALIADKGPIDPDGAGVRARSRELLGSFLNPVLSELADLVECRMHRDDKTWSSEERKRIEELTGFTDVVGWELYFATGTFESTNEREERVTDDQRNRFLREGWSIISSLADVGLPRLAHHLLEILETHISAEPRETFLMISRVVSSGTRSGYQHEPLAEELIVRIIEQYLADHKALFREDKDCQAALLETLDTFVRAGWPSAQRVSYHLDEVFR